MSNTLFPENVNWSQLRTDANLTLLQTAEKTGYSVATINGLELHGSGSDRLKIALAEAYGVRSQLEAEETQPGVNWRDRAIKAEGELRAIKRQLLNLAERSLDERSKKKP
jgi:hypothetical protein